jgi:hypothetical protein
MRYANKCPRFAWDFVMRPEFKDNIRRYYEYIRLAIWERLPFRLTGRGLPQPTGKCITGPTVRSQAAIGE